MALLMAGGTGSTVPLLTGLLVAVLPARDALLLGALLVQWLGSTVYAYALLSIPLHCPGSPLSPLPRRAVRAYAFALLVACLLVGAVAAGAQEQVQGRANPLHPTAWGHWARAWFTPCMRAAPWLLVAGSAVNVLVLAARRAFPAPRRSRAAVFTAAYVIWLWAEFAMEHRLADAVGLDVDLRRADRRLADGDRLRREPRRPLATRPERTATADHRRSRHGRHRGAGDSLLHRLRRTARRGHARRARPGRPRPGHRQRGAPAGGLGRAARGPRLPRRTGPAVRSRTHPRRPAAPGTGPRRGARGPVPVGDGLPALPGGGGGGGDEGRAAAAGRHRDRPPGPPRTCSRCATWGPSSERCWSHRARGRRSCIPWTRTSCNCWPTRRPRPWRPCGCWRTSRPHAAIW
ncbi:hypothetical protein RB201_35170 [Streptomyces sp. S1A(2023)]